MFRTLHLAAYCTIASAVLLAGSVPASAAEFGGDLVMISKTQSIQGRIYVKDSVYRMDLAQQGVRYSVIVNQESNESTVFDPPNKTYRVYPTKSAESLQNDPFQAVQYGDSIGVREYHGVDTVDSWACDKYLIRLGSNPLMAVWVPEALGFPIRIKNLMSPDSAVVIVTNIEVGVLDTTTFDIPDTYTRDDAISPMPGERANVKAGGRMQMSLDPGRRVEVALINVADGSSECVVEFSQGGNLLSEELIGPLAQRTFVFTKTGEQTRRIFDVVSDHIVVKVVSGEIAVEVIQVDR